jgi:hypothetical protein
MVSDWPACKWGDGWFGVWFRERVGWNQGNTVSAAGFDTKSVETRSQNRKELERLRATSDNDFAHCVRWLGYAFPGETAKRVFQTFGTDLNYNVIEDWVRLRSTILDFVIVMASVGLPIHVFLWITDWLPQFDLIGEHKKIQYICSVLASIKRVKQIK